MKARLRFLPMAVLCGVVAWLGATPAATEPIVSNGHASQHEEGLVVDITYELTGATAATRVAILVSTDDAISWSIVPQDANVTGDAGSVTTDGSKTIAYNAKADLPTTKIVTTQARAKVIGIDGVFLPGNVPLEMVSVAAENFQMGANANDSGWSDPDEYPAHTVTFANGFSMGKFKVTQRQWVALMETNPAHDAGVGDNYPVYNVSWNDIRGTNGFLDKLNAHIASTSQGPATFRLPSEAEWEYACRAGSQTRFCFGNSDCSDYQCSTLCNLGDYAWYCGNNSPYGTKPVGGKLPNAFGLFDMHGNVSDWCEDGYHENYTGAPADGSAWVSTAGSHRVFRGGDWAYNPRDCRSASRLASYPDDRRIYIGFRVVR
ncbi:MAG: formylglycine-generating enzyme family protein [Candidatus Sumerlaeota bacterium]|nr:formylglycine-generating enzyme family protein [Candidatus Sumerlaeota bacterium]